MKAWLITWDWAAKSPPVEDEIAAILPPRWAPDRVASFVEQLYAHATYTVAELAAYAKHPDANPYPVQREYADIMTCGHNPWLYARKVSDLKVERDENTGLEIISWMEPDIFRRSLDTRELVLVVKGSHKVAHRSICGALSSRSPGEARQH